jgi:predicted nucleotidyltransferase
MLDLARDTIFVTLAGSHAHGTARAGSDVDVRGVCVAPLAMRLSLFERFEQTDEPLDGVLLERVLPRLLAHETARQGLSVKTESVIFDVAKLLRLAAEANPSALEMLFTSPEDWLLETPAWRRIHDARERFLSLRVADTYVAYANAQLRKIKSHRAWLEGPPPSMPSRAALGLPETSVLDAETRAAVDDTSLNALPKEVARVVAQERAYRAALRRFRAYETWKRERNPARAALESEHGYDTKHAMHLLRLMRTGVEVLERGALDVKRPDATELVAVRDGTLTYDALLASVDALTTRAQEAKRASALPMRVDPAFVDALYLEITTGSRAGE